MNNQTELEVKCDSSGEPYLELPDDLLDRLNWKVGDDICWNIMPNGEIYIHKQKDQ